MRKINVFLLSIVLTLGVTFTASADPFYYDAFPNSLPASISSYMTTYSVTIAAPSDLLVDDVNVLVDISHTWMGDLDIFIGHGTTWVQLFNQTGGSGDDMDMVWFDDEATTSIDDATPAFGPGSFMPTSNLDSSNVYGATSTLLSAFDGQALAGMWTLAVYDNYWLDEGFLNQFAIGGEASAPVPEPATMLLFGCGLAGLIGYSRKRSKKN